MTGRPTRLPKRPDQKRSREPIRPARTAPGRGLMRERGCFVFGNKARANAMRRKAARFAADRDSLAGVTQEVHIDDGK